MLRRPAKLLRGAFRFVDQTANTCSRRLQTLTHRRSSSVNPCFLVRLPIHSGLCHRYRSTKRAAEDLLNDDDQEINVDDFDDEEETSSHNPNKVHPIRSELIQEVVQLQEKYRDHILLTQVGSFFEIYDMAPYFEECAELLGLKIARRGTKRGSEREARAGDRFIGFPSHQRQRYVDILLQNGKTVAVAEQVGADQEATTKLKRRSVVRVFTPGTDLESEWIMDYHGNNFLLSVVEPQVVGKRATQKVRNVDDDGPVGIAWLDLSTGEFYVSETSHSFLATDIARLQPREILLDEKYRGSLTDDEERLPSSILDMILEGVADRDSVLITYKTSSFFDPVEVHEDFDRFLLHSIDVSTVSEKENLPSPSPFSRRIGKILDDSTDGTPEASPLQLSSLEVLAAGALMRYVAYTLPTISPRFRKPIEYKRGEIMRIDRAAIYALELVRRTGYLGRNTESQKGTLTWYLDKTCTAAGGRLLSMRLKEPSMNISEINRRLDLVEFFFNDERLCDRIRRRLNGMVDVERMMQSLVLETAGPKAFTRVLAATRVFDKLKRELQTALDGVDGSHSDYEFAEAEGEVWEGTGYFDEEFAATTTPTATQRTHIQDVLVRLKDLTYLADRYESLIAHDAQSESSLDRPGIISENWTNDETLTKLRGEHTHALNLKVALQQKVRDSFRLSEKDDVRLEFDASHGPYIEVVFGSASKKTGELKVGELRQRVQQDPGADIIGKQRGSSSLRFRHAVWGEVHNRHLSIVERLVMAERKLFKSACREVTAQSTAIISTARAIAEIDLSTALAFVARRRNLTRPTVVEEPVFDIQRGRHPVVEHAQLTRMQQFIPNDAKVFGNEMLLILTGPNMAGKSTFLRQNALVCVLAQMGCFVPAQAATVGLADQIFARVGASDDLTANQSTFMVSRILTLFRNMP
ncbi:DNA mismatch repair protein MutS [Cladochytrium replicatum]|nr:DNA mismatch repair protein MutS [Cladochytrium replicatum]